MSHTATQQGTMACRRPEQLTGRINREFEHLQQRSQRGELDLRYGFHGDASEYVSRINFRDTEVIFNSSDLIAEIEDVKQRKLRVLDMGCGAGALVLRCLQDGHDAHGLTAHDYRLVSGIDRIASQIPNERYFVGDAHSVGSIPGMYDEYDVIVSRYLFIHLSDPLATLEQAANLVAVGGALYVDKVGHGRAYAYDPRSNSVPIMNALDVASFNSEYIDASEFNIHIRGLLARRSETGVVCIPTEYNPNVAVF